MCKIVASTIISKMCTSNISIVDFPLLNYQDTAECVGWPPPTELNRLTRLGMR